MCADCCRHGEGRVLSRAQSDSCETPLSAVDRCSQRHFLFGPFLRFCGDPQSIALNSVPSRVLEVPAGANEGTLRRIAVCVVEKIAVRTDPAP